MSRKDGFWRYWWLSYGAQFCCHQSRPAPYAAIIAGRITVLLVAFPAIFFVARPKVPLTLLLGYGLTISFGQFAFLFCAIKFGMPAGLASLVLQAQAFLPWR